MFGRASRLSAVLTDGGAAGVKIDAKRSATPVLPVGGRSGRACWRDAGPVGTELGPCKRLSNGFGATDTGAPAALPLLPPPRSASSASRVVSRWSDIVRKRSLSY